MDVGAVMDLSFWFLVSGLGGSRLLYIALNAGDFARTCAGNGGERGLRRALWDCTSALRLWEGGLVFYGGALAAGAAAVVFARRKGWSFAGLGDLFAPSLALGHALGRMGCFLAGCCFGKTCPPGAGPCVAFPADSVAHYELEQLGHLSPSAPFTPRLHPTQLYEAGGELAIFFLLVFWRRRQRRSGQLFVLYALSYALLRAVVEVFRGDAARKFVVEVAVPALARVLGLPPREAILLSTSQAVSILGGHRRNRGDGAPTTGRPRARASRRRRAPLTQKKRGPRSRGAEPARQRCSSGYWQRAASPNPVQVPVLQVLPGSQQG
jgi:phosphatidylglycerol:prolipoprotein diacylglycerol transferase